MDDASVKWIGADRTVIRLPVATLSAIMLGPGTTVTHAAIKAKLIRYNMRDALSSSSRSRSTTG